MGDKEKINLIKQIFETMEYENDFENIDDATKWLKTKENRIFAYIDKENEQPNGEIFPIKNANTEENLCDIHVPEAATIEAILKATAKAKNKWIEISPMKRAEIIYKLGTEIQRKQDLFVQLEIAARGILSKDTKNKALPLLTDFFHYYSSFSLKNNSENSSSKPKGKDFVTEQFLQSFCIADFGREYSNGNVSGLSVGILPENNSLSAFGYLLGPSLAAGNKIILQTSPQLSLVAKLLIELAIQVGVPNDTIRLVPGNIDPSIFFLHPEISTVSIFDDPYKEQYLIANNFNKKFLHFNSSGSSMVVFDNCDLDSACHIVVDAAWGYKGMLPWSVRNIFVQEDVFDKFVHKLKHEIDQIKVGKSNQKNVDVSRPDDLILAKVAEIIQKAKSEGVEIYQPNADSIIPTILIGANIFPNNVIKEDFINVPVVTVVAFRTINEAVALANNTRQGLGLSIWTESTSLVNEVIGKLKVGNIWVNSHGLFSANISVSPYKTSGNAFFGGKDGFNEHSSQVKTLKIETISQTQSGEAMEKAINEAKKGQDAWSKLSQFHRIKRLQAIAQNIQANKNTWNLPEKWVDDWTSLIHEYVWNHSEENFFKLENFNVVTCREPCGIIAIETLEDKECHNKKLILAALFEGNAAIILNESKETVAFYSSLSKLLPNGVLTVISHSQDSVRVAALHKELNVYVGETSNKVFGSLPLKSSSKFRVANLDDWQEVCSKVSLVKNIWLSKGQSFI